MSDYVLVMASNPTGLPCPIGVIAAEGQAGRVYGEAVIGEGDSVEPAQLDDAITILRSLPNPGEASAADWLRRLDGLTNGVVRLSGPWSWEAQWREIVHW